MQVAYATQYELSPFEWHCLELDSPAGRYSTNAVYIGTTGKIAEESNKFCELETKEVEK
jgi:hypothetical protein